MNARSYPNLDRIHASVIAAWPDHAGFIAKRMMGRSDAHLFMADELAGLILRLCDGKTTPLVAGYRWMCDRMVEEELFFRRNGRYRVTSFQEAVATVYADAEVMVPYLNGLLLSQVMWSNHTDAALWFSERFLATAKKGGRYLEIGPGHGLLLALAARASRAGSLAAWDVSETSLEMTRRALTALKVDQPVAFERYDIFTAPPPAKRYDDVVLSEILEHLENPVLALKQLKACLAEGGRLFVNMPVNSPAPDHIYCLTQQEQVFDMIAAAGYSIDSADAFPAVGYTPERARKVGATMSCVAIARPL